MKKQRFEQILKWIIGEDWKNLRANREDWDLVVDQLPLDSLQNILKNNQVSK